MQKLFSQKRYFIAITAFFCTSCISNGSNPSFRSLAELLSRGNLITTDSGTLIPDQTTSSFSQARFAVALDDIETIGPFSNWKDAKLDYGAVGDGVADDTAALQTAITTSSGNGVTTLKLPAGNYKITSSLIYRGNPSLRIIGESPTQTRITWAGPQGNAMLIVYGGSSRFSRITWDGKNTAGFGIANWWNSGAGYPQGSSSLNEDEVFQDMSIGIMGGRLGSNFGQMDAEGTIRRVSFIRNTFAGVDTGSFNALDWWIFESKFIDCARGVTNNFTFTDNTTVTFANSGPNISNGAGAFYVYRSTFQGSTVADIDIGNTGWFSMHENFSINSRRFYQSAGMGANAAPTIVQGNRIINTTDPSSLSMGNTGPLILMDNQIKSRSSVSAKVIALTDWTSGRDVFSIGNTYTVNNPVEVVDSANDRLVSIDDLILPAGMISEIPPTLPPTPPWSNRQVFEVSSGASSAAIQSAINAAAQSGSPNAIVHLAPGNYLLSDTLVVPARTKIQIAGELGTVFDWRGIPNGNMLSLAGPSYATVRGINFITRNSPGSAITVSNADQLGGRVFIENSSQGMLSGTNLIRTQLHTLANPYIFRVAGGNGASMLNLSHVQNYVSQASGPVGPIHAVQDSSALISDSWYEGEDSNLHRFEDGTYTFMGAVLAPASHQPITQPLVPAIQLSSFKGKATYIGVALDLRQSPGGVGIRVENELAETKALFLGMAPGNDTYYSRANASGPGSVGLSFSKTCSSSSCSNKPELGNTSVAFIKEMLTQVRSLTWDRTPYLPPAGSTDVHLYDINTMDTTLGVRVSGN